jgi:osomolarity two-component system sensor histidine kinase SLN1
MSRNDSNTSPPPELQDGLPHLIDPTIKEDNRSRTSMMSASEQAGVNGAPYNAHTLHFEFEVEDTGPGIAPHLQQKIFEPFVQGDLRLTKKFGGTGLGLSICSQLSKLMGGSISLESTEGVGSKFTLHLPLKLVRSRSDSNATSPVDGDSRRSSMSFGEHSASHHTPSRPHTKDSNTTTAPSASADPAYFDVDSKTRLVGLSQPYFSTSKAPLASPSTDDTKKAESSRLRVLVAEDNTVNQEVVVRMLRLEEIFDVHLAKDGQEALDKVKESMEKGEQYDLIFMDVQMPRIDGRESTREIRKLGYNRPIVALTAFADDINKKECLDSGMSDFMAKPIRRPALKHVLKTYCPPPPIAEVDETGSLGGSSPALLGKGAQDPFAKSVNGQAAKDLETPMVSPGSEVPRKAT